jgi:hypothetical protein
MVPTLKDAASECLARVASDKSKLATLHLAAAFFVAALEKVDDCMGTNQRNTIETLAEVTRVVRRIPVAKKWIMGPPPHLEPNTVERCPNSAERARMFNELSAMAMDMAAIIKELKKERG